MKTIITTTLLLISLNLFSQQIAYDKQAHLRYGAAIGAGGTWFGYNLKCYKDMTVSQRKVRSIIWGTASAALVGSGKEIYDTMKPKPTGFDTNDIIYTVAAAALTSITINLFIRDPDNVARRKARRDNRRKIKYPLVE